MVASDTLDVWTVFVALSCGAVAVVAVNNERTTKSTVYYMDDLCASSHASTVHVGVAGQESAVVLRATRHYLENDFNCTVHVTTRKDRSLLYSIASLDLPMTCLSYLQVWEDRMDGHRFCRNVDDPMGKEAHWVASPDLFVQLITSKHDWNYERKAFDLVLTSYRQSLHFDGCFKGEFQCANKFCVWKELMCNNENNCGDLSDENCMSKTLSIIVTIAAGITVVILIFVLVSYIRKRRQQAPHDLSRATSTQSFQSVGSGMSGAVDTTYVPLYGKALLDTPMILVNDLPTRTSSSDDVVPREMTEKRLKPCIRYDRSLSDPM